MQNSRISKARFFFDDPAGFRSQLIEEITAFVSACGSDGVVPCVRLNGTSDIPWEGLQIVQRFPHLRFYDYTKNARRALLFAAGGLPPNYHLTFSRSECNEPDAVRVLEAGGNVAAVFSDGLPRTWNGFPVVNGDTSDLRFLDPKRCVVGLRAKGAAKRDVSGFVLSVNL